MRKFITLLVVAAALTLPAFGHDYWLKPEGETAVLIYGHADSSEAYKSDVIKAVAGWALDGSKKEVTKAFAKDQLRLSGKNVSTWAVEIDNGFWTKSIQGWKNVSKRKQSKYLKSTWDRHFTKLVTAKKTDQVVGHPLEIVLTTATASKLEGKVMLHGKPAAGITLESNHKKIGTTDENGRFSSKGRGKGLQVLSAHKTEKLDSHPDADFLNLDATLSVLIP